MWYNLQVQEETVKVRLFEWDTGNTLEDYDFEIPEFTTQEEFDAWWDALPKVKAEVDPRLKERIKTSIRLSRRTIEGFAFLAKQKGIRSGQTLMKIVLESYLSKSLPADF